MMQLLVALLTSTTGLFLLKLTAILGLSLFITGLLRTRRAALRHIVLATGLVGTLCVPAATLLSVPIPIPNWTHPVPAGINPVSELPADRAILAQRGAAVGKRSDAVVKRSAWHWVHLISGIWLLGAALVMSRIITAWRTLPAYKLQCSPWPRGQHIVTRMAASLDIGRHVDVVIDSRAAGPATFGARRLVIVFPGAAVRWSDGDLHRAARHELEHIRRGDYIIQVFAHLISAMYWFHPLTWVVLNHLELEAEQACDDAVVIEKDESAYARLLVALAGRMVRQPPATVVAMANWHLRQRVAYIMAAGQKRGPVSRRTVLVVGFGGIAVALAVALAKPVPALAAAAGSAQSGEAQLSQAFDATSVKISREIRPRTEIKGGHFTATGMSLRDLLIASFQVHGSQLVNGPSWMESLRFDINARTERIPPGGPAGMRPLIHALLKERFGLQTRRELREMDAFVLRRIRSDAPLPPALQPSASTCDGATVEERRANTREGWPPCGLASIENVPAPGTTGVTTHTKRSANSMVDLTTLLYGTVGGPVIDDTRLTGRFDIELKYVRPGPGALPGDPLPEGPTLLIALEEQLGLRVEARRVPVPVIVIEAVQHPSPD